MLVTIPKKIKAIWKNDASKHENFEWFTESKIKENKDKKNHIRLEYLIKLCKGDTNLVFKT